MTDGGIGLFHCSFGGRADLMGALDASNPETFK